jgi:hypothetical protein
MSLIHPKSPNCTIEQLELFSSLPTCSQVQRSVSVPHYSISSLTSGTNILEWVIQGSGDQYIDLAKTKLYVKFKIMEDQGKLKVDKAAAGTNPAVEKSKVAPLSNFIGSMWNQCDIFLNEKLVTSSNNLYSHRAYIEQLLNYGPDTGEKQLSTQLFYLDTAGKHDTNADNKGFNKRQEFINGSRACEIIGPLFTDLTNQPKYLINNVDVRIKLSRHNDPFCLMGFDGDQKGYNVQIEEAILYVQKVNLDSRVQLAHETVLRKNNAIYNMQRTELKSFTIAAGDTSFTREHISLGLSPKYAIVGLISTQAMQGLLSKNPFNFNHYNLKKISMNVDGEQVPLNAINCDYANENYMEGYQSLLDVVGKWKTDQSLMIDREEYAKGYTLYGFQLCPEMISGAFNLVKNTNIRLDLQFSSRLPENVTVLVWFAYDSVLEINASREVFYDFSA